MQPKIRVMTLFDRSVIKRNWKNINESPLKKAGLKIRNRAVTSIRKDKRRQILKSGKRGKFGKASSPGSPPFSRAPGDPMRLIYSVPHNYGILGIMSVIIGPVGFGNAHPVPEVHEKGLSTQISRPSRNNRRQRKIVNKKYPKRAFMVPAYEKVEPSLPPLWKGSLSG